ncbi:MAG: hypothetical protein E7406_04565 [Ruminococcaceae bacterium]|nr:hypothetical protein [Oscillospiraceae bacterium]
MSKTDWRAKWISLGWKQDAYPMNIPIAYKKEFSIDEIPQDAQLNIAAYQHYALWLNGKTVSHGPSRSFPGTMYYDTIDITEYLMIGENHIAVVVFPANPALGYSIYERTGLLIQTNVGIYTDSSWKVAPANWYGLSDLVLSLPAGYQEHYDSRKTPADWKIKTPSDWQNAFVLGGVSTPPWKTLSPREIPLLTEKEIEGKLVWQGKGSREIIESGNLAIAFENEALSTADGDDCNVFTYDFGKTRYIRPAISCEELSGNVRFELYYSLVFDGKPCVDRAFRTAREGFADSFTPSENEMEWEAFLPKGFRFLTVKVAGDGKCRFTIKSKAVDYPYGEGKLLHSDDELLQKIWHTAAETIKSSTNDAIVDTCSRENMLWTMDACFTAEAAYTTFGELQMWRRCLSLIGQGIDSDGIPSAVVPAQKTYMILFDQAFTWVRSCLKYCEASKDLSLLEEVSPKITSLLYLCEKHITEEDLFSPPDYSWHFVDWAPIDKRPYSLPVNALLIMAADAGEKIGSLVNNENLERLSLRIANRLRNAAQSFYSEEDKAFITHIEPKEEIPHNSFGFIEAHQKLRCVIHGNSLAITAKIGTEEQRKNAAAFCVDAIANQSPYTSGMDNFFGPGWTDTLLAPLLDYGYEKEVIAFVKKAYGAFIDVKAPTFGENFLPSEHNSAHGWGASVNTLLDRIF